MIKNRGKRIAWILFGLTIIGSVLLVGCTSSRKAILTENEIPTQAEEPADEPTDEPNQKVLIVTGEYVPYVGQSLESQGFITKLIEAALKKCDFEYEIEFYPWARCSEMVQSGEAWASFPFGHSEFNDQTYLFSDTIYNTKHKFYYFADNEKITIEVLDFDSIGNFTNYTFGGANGYWYGGHEDFEATGVTVEWAADTDALLKMLYSKRIDFFIEDVNVCNEAINRLFQGEEDKFVTLPKDAKVQDYFLIVSKDYPNSQEFLDQFNSSFKEVMKNNN